MAHLLKKKKQLFTKIFYKPRNARAGKFKLSRYGVKLLLRHKKEKNPLVSG